MHDASDRRILLEVAAASIRHGLEQGRPLPVHVDEYPQTLRQPGASFVTLNIAGQLRGCIGSLEATRPLVEDVADNAYAAAFRDPRFPPLNEVEYPQLEYHISLLAPAEPMQFESEDDLIRQLRPGVDGLILSDRGRRGTFLPSVWQSLPDPREFLRHLKQKAGLPPDYWSDTLQVARYTVEEFGN
ncbi:MAG TPA: AmmeMemoRadiSam system protein A [Chromatiales bacterium]|nr:AmmeMemoRadiSam system protein A [Chromatiales bacterium]